ncbi:MAG: S41 family peptidase [Bacteroidales bacterium]|nr:S41 family peptidase [Bacteroidales bacterium]
MKKITAFFIMLTLSVTALAQSQDFTLGQSLEIQNSILRHLARNYVDSLEFDKMMKAGIDAMLGYIDPYTMYFPEEEDESVQMMTTGMYGGVGAVIRKRVGGGVVINEPYPDSPIAKAGLVPGDTIIAINDVPVFDETSEQSSSRMKGQPNTDVKFKVIKGGTRDTIDVVVTRETIHRSDVEYSGIIRDSIGYIQTSGFTQGVSDELRQIVKDLKARGAKRLVLDLRGNGGGLMEEAIEILSIFVPQGTMVVSSKGRMAGQNHEYRTKGVPVDTLIPLMIMVDSGSASASEIVAGAVQDLDRGVIAGAKTYGKGLIQTILPTAYNGTVKITTGKYYTPSGRCVQAIDYSHRNADGSVGAIPDSLTSEFRTKNGRIVKDGGGITPDIKVESHIYSRPTVSLVYNGILDDYAVKYRTQHAQIAPVEQFRLTDAEFEDFISYACDQEFDYRSGIQAQTEQLKRVAEQDGLYDMFKDEIDALVSKMQMDKADVLRSKKDEILPLLENEVAVRYYFYPAGPAVNLKYDEQLDKCLDNWK